MSKPSFGTRTSIQWVISTLLLLAWCLAGQVAALEVTICRDPGVAPHLFAAAEIKAAVGMIGGTVTEQPLTAHNAAGVTGARVILAKVGDAISGWNPLPTPAVSQAYAIRVRQVGGLQEILVLGHDAVGTQYGGLDVAEAISIGTLATLASSNQAPKVPERGIKLNIPLDARNPSYSDMADAAQASMADIWDLAFWRDYLDEMARQRLNTLSLWSLHPFPSMVTVPEYPAVALTDVVRTKVPFDSVSTKGGGIWEAAEMGGAANLEVVKVMTPAQKTAFWNTVLDMAEARGVNVYLFTWNIFTDGLEGNPYGIVLDTNTTTMQASAVTKQYFRRSVRALLTSLPKLAGLGITAGEQMAGTDAENATWLADTYGAGMNDAKVGYTATTPSGSAIVVPANPTRPLRLIHRLHQTSYDIINTAFGKYKNNIVIDTSHKYCKAWVTSTTKPDYVLDDIAEAPPEDQVWLTVRFDAQYNTRWGDADFVRSWVNNLPSGLNGQGEPKLKGFYMGPDGYTWARRTNARGATGSQLDIRRWWYTQQLFGRLSYDPTITNAYFNKLVAARLNITEQKATTLNNGLIRASRIMPLLLRFYFAGGGDYQYFPEGCRNTSGFVSVTNYMNNTPIGGGDGNGESPKKMKDFCTDIKNGVMPAIDTGARLDAEADAALSAIAALSDDPAKPEYNETLADIRIMAALGKYYAAKFRGARDLMLATTVDTANASTHRANAVTQLTDALAKWKTWAGLMAASYHPTRLARSGPFDPMAFAAYAANDIAIAQQLTTGGPTVQTQPKLNSQSGATASLSVLGTSTTDSESQLKYHWFLDGTRPAAVSYSTNYNNAAKNVTVTFAKPGRYLFRVIILDSNNRYKETNTVEVRHVASTTNQPPVANAGTDTSISDSDGNGSQVVALNGSGSSDSDGTITSYVWKEGITQIATGVSPSVTLAVGTHTITLTVTDNAGATHSDTVVVTVTASVSNTAPTISAIADLTINEDTATAAIPFTVGDAQIAAGSLTVSATSSNTTLVPVANISFGGSGANRTVTVTPAANQNGSANIIITVSDGSLSTNEPFTLTVTAVNDAPVVANPITDKNATVGSTFNYTAPINTFTDVDNATLTWSASGMPAGISFDPVTRKFSGTPTTTGSPTITVIATDAGGLSVNTTFKITVSAGTPPPPSQPDAPSTVVSGTSITVSGVTTTGGETVHIFDNRVEVTSIVSGSDGTWSYTITGLSAGEHQITVRYQNAGGISAPSNPTPVTIAGGGTPPPASDGGGGGGGCGLGGLSSSLFLVLFAFMKFTPWFRPAGNTRMINGLDKNKESRK